MRLKVILENVSNIFNTLIIKKNISIKNIKNASYD